MSTNVDIAGRLRELRLEEGYVSERGFADELTRRGTPVSNTTVGNYEQARTGKIPAEYVAQVCAAFGYSEGWLLNGREPKKVIDEHEAVRRLGEIQALALRPMPRPDPEPTTNGGE